MNRSTVGCLVALLIGAGCAGPQVPAAGPAASPGQGAGAPRQSDAPRRITVAIKGNAFTLHNKLNIGSEEPGIDVMERLLSASMAHYDEQERVMPQLAEEVPTIENGLWKLFPDGRMETTWRIKPNARWHDGAPFTADDILFEVAVSRDRELAAFRNRDLGLTDAIEALDPHTLLIRWKQPYIAADTLFNSPHLPKHLLERAYAEDKTNFSNLPYWTEEFVGTGAFKLREYARGSLVHFISDQLIMMGLFYQGTSKFVSNRVEGVTAGSQGWNAHEWSLKG